MVLAGKSTIKFMHQINLVYRIASKTHSRQILCSHCWRFFFFLKKLMNLVVCTSSLECLQWDISLWKRKNAIIGFNAGSANIIMQQGILCERFTLLQFCVKRFNFSEENDLDCGADATRVLMSSRQFSVSLWQSCLLLNFMTWYIIILSGGTSHRTQLSSWQENSLPPTAASGLYAGHWHPPSHLSLQHRRIFSLLLSVTGHFAF